LSPPDKGRVWLDGVEITDPNEIIFMEHGVIVEEGPPQQLFSNPKHKRTGEFLHKITELYGESEK